MRGINRGEDYQKRYAIARGFDADLLRVELVSLIDQSDFIKSASDNVLAVTIPLKSYGFSIIITRYLMLGRGRLAFTD